LQVQMEILIENETFVKRLDNHSLSPL
jgi:hypothetical protein